MKYARSKDKDLFFCPKESTWNGNLWGKIEHNYVRGTGCYAAGGTDYVGITINVLAQDIYVPGKIAEGKSAAYHCVTNGIFLRLYNVNNSDTTWTMVYKNGESASTYEPEALPLFKQEELIEIFCSELTAEELDKIRGKYGYFLGLMIVCDSEGNAEEINFWFRNNDPILLAFSPDRFYGLEQRLKEVLKVRLSTTDRTIASIKYVEAIGYKDID